MTQASELTEEKAMQPMARVRWSRVARYSLGLWSLYFVLKLCLYWLDLIGFHAWENLVFAAFILISVEHVVGRRVKQAATVLLAVILLYYDSWLPDFDRVLSQASLVSGFSTAYLFELAGRFISLTVVAILLAAGLSYWILSRWLRLDTVVILVMISMPMTAYLQGSDSRIALINQKTVDSEDDWYEQASQPMSSNQLLSGDQIVTEPSGLTTRLADAEKSEQTSQPLQSNALAKEGYTEDSVLDMDKVLQRFYKQESARSVSFPTPKQGDVPFDVIFVQICSLSWDDLKVTGLDNHPLWRSFDILLTRFNSASTYSGPAAIRIQRATCGQSTHASLYSFVPDKCYLMDSLKRSGFEPNLVLNHDGHFDNFLKLVQAQGRFNVAPLPLNEVIINQHAFDDTPIYEDISVLNRWLEARRHSASSRVAMYYNTVSLHDGNHLDGVNARLNSRENFKIRLTKLLDDLDGFIQQLEKSGRNAVIAIVPEHGAALRGDKMQIAGLREIPSPSITLVPVGIKVIGAEVKRIGEMLKIDKPTSYLAVSHIVSRFLAKSPYGKSGFVPSDYVANLPVTPFVSQNEEMVMAGFRGRYYFRQGASEWVDYTDF